MRGVFLCAPRTTRLFVPGTPTIALATFVTFNVPSHVRTLPRSSCASLRKRRTTLSGIPQSAQNSVCVPRVRPGWRSAPLARPCRYLAALAGACGRLRAVAGGCPSGLPALQADTWQRDRATCEAGPLAVRAADTWHSPARPRYMRALGSRSARATSRAHSDKNSRARKARAREPDPALAPG
jgi:hypothetical protein